MTTERENTMANFTPGPWEVQTPLGPDILSIVPAGKPTYEWDTIADCTADEPSHGITKEEAAANARLIAAAPDLLAACVALEAAEDANANCTECEGQGVPELCPACFPLFDDARLKRRAAIARAEGRDPGEAA